MCSSSAEVFREAVCPYGELHVSGGLATVGFAARGLLLERVWV